MHGGLLCITACLSVCASYYFFFPQQQLNLGSWNLVRTFTWMTPRLTYTTVTVSAEQLLFVWCSLSDDCQTIARCLSDVSPDVCQLPPDICQTSTTYTPDIYMYHTSGRYVVDVWYMSGGCLVYIWHSICLVSIWYMSGVWYLSDRCLVGVDRCLVGHLTDDRLTGSNRQIATVWRKRWSRGSRSPGQKERYFRRHFTNLRVIFELKGHMGQGQRSHGSWSKVTWVEIKGQL